MDIYADKIRIEEFGLNNMLSALVAESQNVIHLQGQQYNIKLCFSENEDFNAAAYEMGTKSWINISMECVKQIYHHSLILMGRPELLSASGFEEEFEGDYLISEFDEPEIIKYDDSYKQLVFYAGPDNSARQKAAELITFFSLEFLMFHELGHHLGGHIRYLSHEMGLTALYAYDNGTAIDSRLYQMLETDADAIAVSTLLESISTKISFYSETFLNGGRDLIPDCIIIAITIVLFLLPEDKEINLQESAYLPRNVRFRLCLDILFDKFRSDYQACMVGQHENAILSEFTIANNLLQELYSQRNDKRGLVLDLKEYRSYYKEVLLPFWTALREKLVPYAALNLPK